ncbi:unnamed protein product [Triticum aestivum]|uniref:BRCT domain-containing protein n=2 Tax=Triticum aestivum TaxID=4565 RepID=A0A9R1EPD4_WHEAT|nr:uncharacterized protein LOC123048575 [Triticum aestivum]KAF7013784.1 hypothetical protein CFC21_027834 [Triticum aestivum]SPT16111.1 unnamed protein product [Triticum aestivum]
MPGLRLPPDRSGRPPLVGGEGGSGKPSLLSPTKSAVFKSTRRLPQESSGRQPPRGGERGSGGLTRGDGGGTQEVEGDGGERGSGGRPSIRSGGGSRGLRGRGASIGAGDAGGDGAHRRSDREPEEEDGSAGAGGATATGRPPAREQAGPSHAGKPFSGFLFVLLDYSDAGITDEDFAAYEEKIESLGGALATGLHYKEATHIIVKGNIPAGARILWESELKQVRSIGWVESCSKEGRLLATEPKGIVEKLISQENTMTPPAKKSPVRNCKSTGSKVLKCSARNKLGVPRRLNFDAHHRHLRCAVEIEDTESLYDYSLRYKMHEYCKLPGCRGVLSCEEGADIMIPTTLKLSKLRSRVILMRSFNKVVKLHHEHFALAGNFSSKNFQIYQDDSIKLDGLAEGAIVEYREAAGDLDYRQFVHMVTEEVFHGQKLPFDLTEWLRIISQGVNACDGSLLCSHIDLMEPYQGYGNFVSLFQLFWKVKDTAGGEDLLNSLGHYKGWKSEGLRCSFLHDTLNYEDDDGHRFEYEDDIRGLLRLLMNSFCHSAKSHCRLAIYLIMNEFRRLLSDLQRALHQGGYLSHLSVNYSV